MANAEPDDLRWVDRCGRDSLLDEARRQLVAYFAGRLKVFDLPLAPNGTEFQRRVWSALTKIPFGATTSYAQLARRVGNEAAVRAVGAANGRNPIPIIVPCHRVIGSNGSLTGFGGGLPRKQWLLRHEGAQGEFDI
jgi:methylated-DNA-[protein]-cysteine S-methyltransferase